MPGIPAADIARVVDIFAEAEATLLEAVAKRLAKGITLEGWTERKYAETQAMRRELAATLQKATAMGDQAVESLITDAFSQGATDAAYSVSANRAALRGLIDEAAAQQRLLEAEVAKYDPFRQSGEYARAAKAANAGQAKWAELMSQYQAAANAPIVGQLARTNVPALRSLLQQTAQDFGRMKLQALRSSTDAYRSVIADTTLNVVAGQSTRLAATQKALNKLAEQGITGFTDTSGRAWSMDSYAEMATRTASNRAYLDGKLNTFQDAGIHLFVVSRSGSPCPKCGPWEGRVLSDAPHAKYPTIDAARGAGLWHPNCGHTLDTFTPGTEKLLDVRPKGPTQAEFDDQRAAYAQAQQQRALERKVREAKRQKAAAITPEAQRKADREIRQAQADLRAHTAKTGRARQYPREQPRTGKGLPPPAAPAPKPTPPSAPKPSPEEIESLNRYIGSDYQAMNALGRGHDVANAEAYRKDMKRLDRLVGDSSLPEDTILYRGTGQGWATRMGDDPGKLVGSVLSDGGYCSTTRKFATADTFATMEESGTIWRIHAPAGSRGVDVGTIPGARDRDEGEVILPRGAKLRIDKVEHRGKWVLDVTATLIP